MSYSYGRYVPTLDQVGIGPNNGFNTNLVRTNGYSNVLLYGYGPVGNATAKPLGNAYILDTGSKCSDKDTGEQVERQAYIDNIPSGSMFGAQTGMMGLIPGILEDVADINPDAVFEALASDISPDCQKVDLIVRNNENQSSVQSANLSTNDIENISPCRFGPSVVNGKLDRLNPGTGQTCSSFNPKYTSENKISNLGELEGFVSHRFVPSKDPLSQMYMLGVGVLLVGIVSRFIS